MPKRKPAPPRRAAKRRPRRKTAPAPGESLRAFGKRVGVSHTAIEKAVRAGRLDRSIVRDARGVPRVVDVGLALQEWTANRAQPSPATPAAATTPAAPPTNGDGSLGLITLSQAQTRATLERGEKLRLENLQRRGRLVDRAAAARESFEIARIVRDSILGVPDRVSAELAAETDQGRVYKRLDQELRTALNALADILASGAPHAEPPAVGGDHPGDDGDAAC